LLDTLLGVSEINERFTGPERRTHVLHHPFDLALIGRRGDTSRVDHETPCLRVLDERLIEPRLQPVSGRDDRREVVRDQNLEDPVEELPCRFAPSDHRVGRLRERQPHEHMPRQRRGEDQRMTHPATAGFRVIEQTKLREIDLQLTARFTIGDRDRRALRSTATKFVGNETMQRPFRHDHTITSKQCVDLHDLHISVEPTNNPLTFMLQRRPGVTMTITAVRTHQLNDLTKDQISQLLDATVDDDAALDRRVHIPADRLAINPAQPLKRADPFTPNPQPENLFHLEHRNLPECHSRLSTCRRNGGDAHPQQHRTGGPRDGPITGGQVVPSRWRNQPQGGPMPLAGDNRVESGGSG
jgi:hypothetical protein